MSKYDDIDDLPPPYTPSAATSTTADPFTTGSSSSSSSSSFLTSHLHNLRAQAEISRDVNDSRLLSRITDAIEVVLTDVVEILVPSALGQPRRLHQQPPKVIEAVVVPDAIIGPGWALSDADIDDRESNKVTRVVRVDTREGKEAGSKADSKSSYSSVRAGPSSSSIGKGFDDWGRWSDDNDDGAAASSGLAAWWSDENLARNVARYLQPIQAPSRPSNAGPSSTAARMGQAVSMTARAEEATFRRENEMGLWESKTGWVIIVRFRI